MPVGAFKSSTLVQNPLLLIEIALLAVSSYPVELDNHWHTMQLIAYLFGVVIYKSYFDEDSQNPDHPDHFAKIGEDQYDPYQSIISFSIHWDVREHDRTVPISSGCLCYQEWPVRMGQMWWAPLNNRGETQMSGSISCLHSMVKDATLLVDRTNFEEHSSVLSDGCQTAHSVNLKEA